jgi:transcriptional regulator with GAF, ATPase, and Fis domain
MARGETIEAEDIWFTPDVKRMAHEDIAAELVTDGFSVEDFERKLLAAALEKTDGNQSRAAELLGLTRRTLQYRMEKYNISAGKDEA